MSYYFKFATAKSVRQMFPKIILNDLRKFPIKDCGAEEQNKFIAEVDVVLLKNIELIDVNTKFLTLLKTAFPIEAISNKLNNWHELDWKTFVSELSKKKIKMTAEQEEKWLDRFNRMSAQAREIKQVIDRTDKEIDQMVYKLYGLTEDEMKIVEQQ